MNATTLNIGANSIKTLTVRGKSARREEIALPPGMIRNGLILQPEAFSSQLRSLVKSGKLTGDRVVCTINGLPFSYRILSIPQMEPAAFNEAVLRAARKEMSISPDEMYLSWQAFPGVDNEMPVLVAGITRHPVDNLIKALLETGMSPWLLDLPHLALARLAQERDVIIADFEKDCSNIVMVVDGMPRGMNMIPTLSAGASLSDQLGQVTDRLAKMIDFYNGSHPARPIKEPARILVTGELLEDQNAFDLIQSQMGYAVEPLAAGEKALSGLPLHLCAVNAGAALLNAQFEKDSAKDALPCRYFNLGQVVKDAQPKTNIPGVLKKVLVPIALTGAISLLALSFFTNINIRSEISDLQTELDIKNSHLLAKQSAAARADQVEDNIDQLMSMVSNIKAGHDEMFSSASYVSDISTIVSCMPSGLSFSSLYISPDKIILDGRCLNASSIVVFADNLETAGGFPEAVIQRIEKPASTGGNAQGIPFSMVIRRP